MERLVVADTETTGLSIRDKHRVIEIAAVEVLIDDDGHGRLTGKEFHRYLNPQRDMDQTVINIHGITNEFLRDKPLFKEVMPEFLAFVQGATFVAHNSSFDEEFLNNEMVEYANSPQTFWECVDHCVDSMALSRRIYGNKGRHSLDALADRLGVDRSARTQHGALIDSQLLASCYLKMIDGVDLSAPPLEADLPRRPLKFITRNPSLKLAIRRASPLEVSTSEQYLAALRPASPATPGAPASAADPLATIVQQSGATPLPHP